LQHQFSRLNYVQAKTEKLQLNWID